MIQLSLFEKCLLQGESGKFLIDKGRVLEWTDDRSLATVYFQCDADLKIINWPNTPMKKTVCFPKKMKVKKELIWGELKIKVLELKLTFWQLEKSSGISYKSWRNWITGIETPRLASELKIKNWLDSL